MSARDELWARYEEAHLDAPGWPESIDLRAGLRPPQRAFLRSLLASPQWAVVTAANPRGAVLDAATNARRHAALEALLRAGAVEFVRCDGRSADGAHVETGFAVSLPLEESLALAREFEQLAIYWFDGDAVRVVRSYTADDG